MDYKSCLFFVLSASYVHINGFSIVTDNDNNTLTSMHEVRVDVKNTDVLRQLLNQETLIRISLVRDVFDMRQTVTSLRESQKECALLISDLQTELTSLKEETKKLKEDIKMNLTNARLTIEDISKKVGFTVGMPSSYPGWFGDVLVFSKVITNIGGGYNVHTGIFTAPVAGMYQFFVTVVGYSYESIYMYIVLNGNPKVTTASEASRSSPYQTGTNMLVVRLDQSDTVWIKRQGGTGYYSDSVPITTFSGVLI
ncbi:uncharacterized protein LOC134251776 [Saccostrea cucullata]|uniref:uncharacterized protein LOC134251776 n=1 Tax=Saccostrea cuccullata TaxID=36930 RepID=UPI002ED034F1